MTIDDQIIDEKLQYDINKEAAKISTLSSGKINKYEYLKGEDLLPSNPKQVIEQAKFNDFLLVKLLKNKQKQLKIKQFKIKYKLRQRNLIKVLTMIHIKCLMSFLMKE